MRYNAAFCCERSNNLAVNEAAKLRSYTAYSLRLSAATLVMPHARECRSLQMVAQAETGNMGQCPGHAGSNARLCRAAGRFRSGE